MIDLLEAIDSKAVYECKGWWLASEAAFRVTVTGFSRTSVHEINGELGCAVTVEGALWLMSLELENIEKEPLDPSAVGYLLQLQDDEGFRFDHFYDGALYRDMPSGLRRFSGWSDVPKIMPKLKAAGSVAYALPEAEARYALVVKGGDIRRV